MCPKCNRPLDDHCLKCYDSIICPDQYGHTPCQTTGPKGEFGYGSPKKPER